MPASACSERSSRHSALLDNALDVVSLCSAENAFLYVSPLVAGVLGYAPEELVGTTVSDLVHPDDLAEYVQGVVEGLRGASGPFGPVEARYRSPYLVTEGHWQDREGCGTDQFAYWSFHVKTRAA